MNLSLGSPNPTPTCTDAAYQKAFQSLRAVGVLAAVAAGNARQTNALTSPACLPEVVSVGATHDGADTFCGYTSAADQVACFSNNAPSMTLWAPGCTLTAGVTVEGTPVSLCGTSMAAPAVAGAIAVMRAAVPWATLDQVVAALKEGGPVVADTRAGGAASHARLSLPGAVAKLQAIAGGAVNASTTPPTASVSINGGAPATGALGVVLSIAANGSSRAAAMCVANEPDACGAAGAFRTFDPAPAWTLGGAAGAYASRSVFVWLRDEWGNVMGAPAVATIDYAAGAPAVNFAPPTGRVLVNGGAAAVPSRAVELTIDAEDDAGPEGLSMCIAAADGPCTAYRSLARTVQWTSPVLGSSVAVYVWLRDRDGYETPRPIIAKARIDAPPQIVSFSKEGGGNFTNTATVRVVARATDASGLRTACFDAAAAGDCEGSWQPVNASGAASASVTLDTSMPVRHFCCGLDFCTSLVCAARAGALCGSVRPPRSSSIALRAWQPAFGARLRCGSVCGTAQRGAY